MVHSTFAFRNGVIAALDSKNGILIKSGNNTLLSLSIEDIGEKRIFNNGLGENIIELSGLSSPDARLDRSWAYAFYQKHGYSKMHYHEKGTEVYYIVSGVAKVIINGKENILRPGEEITISPGDHHQVISISQDSDLEMLVKCSPAWIAEDQFFLDECEIQPIRITPKL